MEPENSTPVEEPTAADLFAAEPPDPDAASAEPWLDAAPPSVSPPDEPYPPIEVDPDIQKPEPDGTSPVQYDEPVELRQPTGEGPAQWEEGSGAVAALV